MYTLFAEISFTGIQSEVMRQKIKDVRLLICKYLCQGQTPGGKGPMSSDLCQQHTLRVNLACGTGCPVKGQIGTNKTWNNNNNNKVTHCQTYI